MQKRNIRLWTIREVNFLRRCVSEMRISAKKIFQRKLFPLRTLGSISGEMAHLGLGDPAVKERVKNAHRLTPEQKAEVLEFLKGEGREMPNDEVAQRFTRYCLSSMMVWYYRRRYGPRLSREKAFSSQRYKDSHRRVVPALQKGRRRYHKQFWRDRRSGLESLMRYQLQRGERPVFKRCKSCDTAWFPTAEFFYRARVRSNGTIRLYNYCKACGLPWERSKRLRKAKPGIRLMSI